MLHRAAQDSMGFMFSAHPAKALRSGTIVRAIPSGVHVSSQIELLGLRGVTDTAVWEYAKAEGYVLVSKDNDFCQRSFQYGAPPKVIWLSVGNAGTSTILHLLRESLMEIEDFVQNPEAALLVLTLQETP